MTVKTMFHKIIDTGLKKCVCVCTGITNVVGTYICLNSHIMGTCLPYGDKNQVPIT